jgi:hypothetical protein
MIVAGTPRERLLCWEEWAQALPFSVADLSLALGWQEYSLAG